MTETVNGFTPLIEPADFQAREDMINRVVRASRPADLSKIVTDPEAPLAPPVASGGLPVHRPRPVAYFTDARARRLTEAVNSGIDPESPVDILQQYRDKRDAERAVQFYTLRSQHDQSLNRNLQEQAARFGLDPDTDADILKGMMLSAGWGEYQRIVGDVENIPYKITSDPVLRTAPDTMIRDLMEIYRLRERNRWIFTDAWNYTANDRELRERFMDGEISLEEFDRMSRQNEYEYGRDGFGFELASTVTNMVQPLATVEGVGAMALTALNPWLGAAAVGAVSAADTYSMEQSQIVTEVMKLNPDITQEEAEEMAMPYSVAAAGLDFLSAGLGMKITSAGLSGLLRGTAIGRAKQALTGAAEAKVAHEGAVKAAAKVENLKKSFDSSMSKAFKAYAATVGSEVLTEGLQGGIEQAGINQISGTEETPVQEAAVNNFLQAAKVMAVLGLVPSSPYAIRALKNGDRVSHELDEQVRNRAAEAIAGNTELSGQGLDNLNAEKMYRHMDENGFKAVFYAEDILDLINEGKLDRTLLGPEFDGLEEKAGTPDHEIVINAADYARTYSKIPALRALEKKRATAEGGPTAEETEEALEGILKTDLERAMAEEASAREEWAAIDQELEQAFFMSGKFGTREQAQLVMDSVHSFVGAMHELLPSFSVTQIFEAVRPTVEGRRLDLSGKDNYEGPSFDLSKFSFDLSEKETFSSIVHELGHFYLESLYRLEEMTAAVPEQAATVRNMLSPVEAMGGYTDYRALSPEQKRNVHELFATGFLNHIANGKAPSGDDGMFLRFRRFVMRGLAADTRLYYRTPEQYTAARDQWLKENGYTPDDWKKARVRDLFNGEIARRELEARFEQSSPRARNLAPGLEQLYSRLVYSSQIRENIEQELPFGSEILEKLGSDLTAPEDIEMLDSIRRDINEIREQSQSHLDALLAISGEAFKKAAGGLDQSIRELEENAPAAALYRRFKELRKDRLRQLYTENYQREKLRYENQTWRRLVAGEIKIDPLSVKGLVSGALLSRLKSKGYLADKNTSPAIIIPIETLARNRDYRPDMKDLAAAGGSKEIRLLLDLDHHVNPRKTALRKAVTRLLKTDLRSTVTVLADDARNKALMAGARKQVISRTIKLVERLAGQKGFTLDDGTAIDLKKQGKLFSSRIISTMRYGDLSPRGILRRSMYFQRAAFRALEQNDLIAAARNLHYQRLLTDAASEAVERQSRLEKRLEKQVRFLRHSDKVMGRRYMIERIAIARALLARIGLMDFSYIPKAREMIAASDETLRDIWSSQLETFLSDNSFATHYQNLPVEVLERVLDLADEQKALGKPDREFYNQVHGEDVVARQEELLEALHKKDSYAATAETGEGMATEFVNSSSPRIWFTENYRKWMMKPMQAHEFLDGTSHKDKPGPFMRYGYEPFRKIASIVKRENRKFHDSAEQILKGLNFEQGRIVTNLRVREPGDGARALRPLVLGAAGPFKGYGQIELFGMLLHLGTDSNFNKLCGGYNVTQDGFIAEFNRLCDEGYITKEMMDAAQKIWDLNKNNFSLAQKAYRLIYGHYMTEVQPRRIYAFGKWYEGGYAPAITNRTLRNGDFSTDFNTVIDLKAFRREDIERAHQGWQITRNEKYQEPLCLDPRVLLAQNERVIRWAYAAPRAFAYYRMLNGRTPQSQAIRAELKRIDPNMLASINKWTLEQVIGTERPRGNPLINTITRLVRNSGAVIMCANLSNTLQQVTGWVSAMSTVNPGMMRSAFFGMFSPGGLKEMRSFATKNSVFMETRLAEHQISIEQSFDSIMLEPSRLHGKEKAGAYLKKWQNLNMKYAYLSQKLFQNLIDVTVWNGAYRDARQNLNMSHDEAVARADESIIKTQGSYDDVDLNNLEKAGPVLRAFTMFSSYSYTMANLIVGEISRANNLPASERAVRKAAIMLTAFVIPNVIASMITAATGNALFEDSEEEDGFMQNVWFEVLFASQLRAVFGMVPVAGQIGNWGLDALQGKNFMTNLQGNTPWATTMSAAFNSVANISAAIADDSEITYRDLRNLGQGIGTVTGTAFLGPVSRSGSFIYGAARGQLDPDTAWEYLMGVLAGKVSASAKE